MLVRSFAYRLGIFSSGIFGANKQNLAKPGIARHDLFAETLPTLPLEQVKARHDSLTSCDSSGWRLQESKIPKCFVFRAGHHLQNIRHHETKTKKACFKIQWRTFVERRHLLWWARFMLECFFNPSLLMGYANHSCWLFGLATTGYWKTSQSRSPGSGRAKEDLIFKPPRSAAAACACPHSRPPTFPTSAGRPSSTAQAGLSSGEEVSASLPPSAHHFKVSHLFSLTSLLFPQSCEFCNQIPLSFQIDSWGLPVLPRSSGWEVWSWGLEHLQQCEKFFGIIVLPFVMVTCWRVILMWLPSYPSPHCCFSYVLGHGVSI